MINNKAKKRGYNDLNNITLIGAATGNAEFSHSAGLRTADGDKAMRGLFLTLIREHGMTILLSSHILSEIEHTADMVGVIVNGTVVQEISLEEIKRLSNIRLEDYFFNIMSGGNTVC